MDQEDILNRLDRLDMEAYTTIDTPHMYKMIIVGGSGLVLLGVIARATQDIDALEASPEIWHLLSDNVLKNLNWERLKHLALDEDEAKASALNESRYRDFLYDYYEYVRSYGPHEGTDV